MKWHIPVYSRWNDELWCYNFGKRAGNASKLQAYALDSHPLFSYHFLNPSYQRRMLSIAFDAAKRIILVSVLARLHDRNLKRSFLM
jgi:hypothetical protein